MVAASRDVRSTQNVAETINTSRDVANAQTGGMRNGLVKLQIIIPVLR